jgi:hypothetical protein
MRSSIARISTSISPSLLNSAGPSRPRARIAATGKAYCVLRLFRRARWSHAQANGLRESADFDLYNIPACGLVLSNQSHGCDQRQTGSGLKYWRAISQTIPRSSQTWASASPSIKRAGEAHLNGRQHLKLFERGLRHDFISNQSKHR